MALRAVWALHTYFATREQMLCKFPTFSIDANVFIRPLWIWSAPLSAPPPPLLQIRSENHICTAALKNQLAKFSPKQKYAKQTTWVYLPRRDGIIRKPFGGWQKWHINEIAQTQTRLSRVCMLANSILLCLQKSLGRERKRILRKQSTAR